MKFLKYLTVACVMLLPVLSFAEDDGFMRISLIQGDVQVSNPDMDEDWTAASINLPLNEGDRLWVPDEAKVETQIRGGVYIRAGEKTAFDVLSLGNDSAQLYLDRGHVYVNNRRGGIKIIQVDIPLASVRSYDNSIMMLDVDEGGATEVSVLKGYVYVETRDGSTRVTSGNTLSVRDNATAEMAMIGSPDEWERWNLDRDKQLVAWNESSRYLPEELHEYSSDFDMNGRWAYASDYGYVWSPSVTILEWAPYTAGTWMWVRNNYVWISYEPWGWVPYHYGRWAYVTGRGWCWVPPIAGAVYWGPGFVGWIMTPTYVAWVPLAPGETYYGYGYYGPASVNITTVNINTVTINKTYRNATARHAVTVVRKDSFGTGRRITERVKVNPFLETKRQKIDVVPPRMKPERRGVIAQPSTGDLERKQPHERIKIVPPEEHRAQPPVRANKPVIKPERQDVRRPFVSTLPAERQPPERVRNIRPEEMKIQRKLVRERDASVFRQERPQNLPVKQLQEPKEIMRKPGQRPEQQHEKKNLEEKPQPRGKSDREKR